MALGDRVTRVLPESGTVQLAPRVEGKASREVVATQVAELGVSGKVIYVHVW